MSKIAATIPGLQDIYDFYSSSDKQPRQFQSLGDLLTGILNIIFFAAVFLAFYYLAWGAFAYMMAQGKKEDLAKARARIAWALIGLAIILLAFFITKFASEIFPPDKGGLPF